MRIRRHFFAAAFAASFSAFAGGCAVAPRSADADRFDKIAWPSLSRFSGEAEFEDYLVNLREARKVAGAVGPADGRVRYAQADPAAEPCLDIDCPGEGDEQIIVTGARISAAPSITNNQTSGVDEGDIVKLVGDHVIILQDGRLFSIGVGDDKNELRLADRANIYASADDDAWYDEILTSGDRIIVTGYSYDRDASEFTIFKLEETGKLTFEDKFFITSDDYYDDENYATRLVGGNLIIYTPIDLYWAGRRGDDVKWPMISRFDENHDAQDEDATGRRLFQATDVYRPVQATLWPTIHAITSCDIGGRRAGAPLNCRTTGIVGPWDREYYVSRTDAYLWLDNGGWEADRLVETAGGCDHLSSSTRRSLANALYRTPLNRRGADFTRVLGTPNDHFAMDGSRSAFRALVRYPASPRCAVGENPLDETELAFFSIPARAFNARAGGEVDAANYAPAPEVGGKIENRFTSDYLVYGGRDGWGSYPPDPEDGPQTSVLVAMPLRAPHTPALIAAPHNVIRIERAGDNIIATGYHDDQGLSLSAIDLRQTPQIASTAILQNRFESEGRSHAFNSLIDDGGAGLLGLPTVAREDEADRWWWRSRNSDVSFLALDAEARLSDLGALKASPAPLEDEENDDEDDYVFAPEGYECEVSCVDWYGNSRPIFIGDRIFALAGFEFIEGEIANGSIREVSRIDITK